MSEIFLPVVDGNDEIITYKAKRTLAVGDVSRVSAIWITNSKWEILLARRSLNKKNDAGKWWPSAAWTVEKDETYESNIIKEVWEEIGLKNLEISIWPKIYVVASRDFFCQRFFAERDIEINDLILQEHEVMDSRRFTSDEILDLIKINPEIVVSNLDKYAQMFLKN